MDLPVPLASDSNGNNMNDDQQSDGDGVPARRPTAHPANANLWSDWNRRRDQRQRSIAPTADAVIDESDSDPTNGNLWSDWNRDRDQMTMRNPMETAFPTKTTAIQAIPTFGAIGTATAPMKRTIQTGIGDGVNNRQDSHPQSASSFGAIGTAVASTMIKTATPTALRTITTVTP